MQSYNNQRSVMKGILASSVPRGDIFITSKVGSPQAMGYNVRRHHPTTDPHFPRVKASYLTCGWRQETVEQVNQVLKDFQTSYIDLMVSAPAC